MVDLYLLIKIEKNKGELMINTTNVAIAIFSSLLHFWWVFAIMIIFGLLKRYLNSAKVKGVLGETGAYLGMLANLDSKKYKIFNNIKIVDQRGKTQIDHVVISKYGIFVIEVKNYQGWIFGNEKEKYWTQNIYGKKTRFYNPLWQNFRHIKALSEYLGLESKYFYNIVFLSGKPHLKLNYHPM